MKKQYLIKHPCKKFSFESKSDKFNFNCRKCNKNVKDLTGLEPRYILKKIKNEVNTCVKVLPNQLRKCNQFVSNSKKAIVYSSILVMTTTSCNRSLIQNFGDEYGKVVLDRESEKEETISQNVIKGKLVDSYYGEPILFAPIRITDHNFETMTDIDGNFTFQIPENIAKSSKVQFDYLGYYRLEIKIDKIKGKHIIVNLGEGPTIGYLELIRESNPNDNRVGGSAPK